MGLTLLFVNVEILPTGGRSAHAADATGLTETATTCSALKRSALTIIFAVEVCLKPFIDQEESICLIVEI